MLRRSRLRQPPRIKVGVPAAGQAARLLAPVLAAAISACSPAPDSPASRPETATPRDHDALWIAVTNRSARSGSDYDGMLVPIARHLDGSWDNAPWAGLFDMSGPGPGIEAVKTGDGVWSWPDASRYWSHPGRALDTLGRTPDLIATGVPRSWFLYSRTGRGQPLSTTGLSILPTHCENRWAIRTDRETLSVADPSGDDALPVIAVTRPPVVVLSEDDIPGLEGIRRNLGFVSTSEGTKGDRRFHWLGLLRFENIAPEGVEGTPGDTTLGILWGRYYEGADYTVIQIDGNRSRVLVRTREGGC